MEVFIARAARKKTVIGLADFFNLTGVGKFLNDPKVPLA